jgi:curli production assembly/transport component CsgG/WD40 domain-containing protein
MFMRGLLATSFVLTLTVGGEAAGPIVRSQPALYPDRDLDAGGGPVADLAFSPDSRLLVAAGGGALVIWDAQTGDLIRRVALGNSPVSRVAFGAQGNLVAAGAEDGRVFLLDLRTGLTSEIVRHPRAVSAVAFAPDGSVGASGDADGGIVLWDSGSGRLGDLQERGASKGILYLAFDQRGALLSLSRDLRVVTWDVAGRRPIRRGTLQFEAAGKTAVPDSATTDPTSSTLAISTQYVITPRGGALTSRAGFARPEDLKRVNVIVPYELASGTSSDAVGSGDFRPERLALSPGACFAFFTSNYRNQARLHLWSLLEKGDDVVRTEIAAKASALALDPAGARVAIGLESGRVKTWKTSGLTQADCDTVRRRGVPAAGEPRIALGSESAPLVTGGPGQRMAVLKFEAGGVEAFLADAVRDMVAGELSNSAGVVVVERSAIEGVVKELELQRSGLTTADAVRIGRGLNARKVLFGMVSRFGAGPQSTFVILTRIVDVETQQVEGTRQVTCENCSEKDLPRAVETLRRSIVP